MKELICSTKREKSYPIIVRKGLLSNLEEYQEYFKGYQKVVVITDENVGNHYLEKVKKELKRFKLDVYSLEIEPGESSKCLDMAEQIYHELASYNITRADLIVTLGGGVVGDLGGFCASTFLRGVNFIQMPTSLLAQVDSSVGGKVGINLPQGKNLVGSFYQPEAVLVDPETLDTLSDRYFADGMAEVIKYGCISSSRLFIQLAAFESKKDLIDNIEQVIYKCCDLKRRVVEKDELEGGHRRILNFGHTIGHVIEAYYNYEKYSHGEGVAIGMYHVTKKSVDEGITDEETLDNLKSILIKYNLPYEMPDIPKKEIKEIVMNDKKMEKEILHMVVITKIGRAKMVKVHKKNVLELFK